MLLLGHLQLSIILDPWSTNCSHNTRCSLSFQADRSIQCPASGKSGWAVKQSRGRKVVIGAGPDIAVSANRCKLGVLERAQHRSRGAQQR